MDCYVPGCHENDAFMRWEERGRGEPTLNSFLTNRKKYIIKRNSLRIQKLDDNSDESKHEMMKFIILREKARPAEYG